MKTFSLYFAILFFAVILNFANIYCNNEMMNNYSNDHSHKDNVLNKFDDKLKIYKEEMKNIEAKFNDFTAEEASLNKLSNDLLKNKSHQTMNSDETEMIVVDSIEPEVNNCPENDEHNNNKTIDVVEVDANMNVGKVTEESHVVISEPTLVSSEDNQSDLHEHNEDCDYSTNTEYIPDVKEPVLREDYYYTKPVEVKPVEVKPVEVKPVEVKPVEVKPVEVKPVEVKPVEVKNLKTSPLVESNNVDMPSMNAYVPDSHEPKQSSEYVLDTSKIIHFKGTEVENNLAFDYIICKNYNFIERECNEPVANTCGFYTKDLELNNCGYETCFMSFVNPCMACRDPRVVAVQIGNGCPSENYVEENKKDSTEEEVLPYVPEENNVIEEEEEQIDEPYVPSDNSNNNDDAPQIRDYTFVTCSKHNWIDRDCDDIYEDVCGYFNSDYRTYNCGQDGCYQEYQNTCFACRDPKVVAVQVGRKCPTNNFRVEYAPNNTNDNMTQHSQTIYNYEGEKKNNSSNNNYYITGEPKKIEYVTKQETTTKPIYYNTEYTESTTNFVEHNDSNTNYNNSSFNFQSNTSVQCREDQREQYCVCKSSDNFVCATMNDDTKEYYRCACKACGDRHVASYTEGLCDNKHLNNSSSYNCKASDRLSVCTREYTGVCAVTNKGLEDISNKCVACSRNDVIAVFNNRCNGSNNYNYTYTNNINNNDQTPYNQNYIILGKPQKVNYETYSIQNNNFNSVNNNNNNQNYVVVGEPKQYQNNYTTNDVMKNQYNNNNEYNKDYIVVGEPKQMHQNYNYQPLNNNYQNNYNNQYVVKGEPKNFEYMGISAASSMSKDGENYIINGEPVVYNNSNYMVHDEQKVYKNNNNYIVHDEPQVYKYKYNNNNNINKNNYQYVEYSKPQVSEIPQYNYNNYNYNYQPLDSDVMYINNKKVYKNNLPAYIDGIPMSNILSNYNNSNNRYAMNGYDSTMNGSYTLNGIHYYPRQNTNLRSNSYYNY